MLGKQYDISVKTIIVGDSGVGKTSLLVRYIRNKFDPKCPPTLGVEFMAKPIEIEKYNIEFQLWDTAGQELFRAVTKGYYRGSIGAFICFDLTNHDSFLHVGRWLNDIIETARKDCFYILVGNKSDLKAERQVPKEEAELFAQNNNMQYFECSSLTGDNINELMLACLSLIKQMIDDGKFELNPSEKDNIISEEKSEKSSCC